MVIQISSMSLEALYKQEQSQFLKIPTPSERAYFIMSTDNITIIFLVSIGS